MSKNWHPWRFCADSLFVSNLFVFFKQIFDFSVNFPLFNELSTLQRIFDFATNFNGFSQFFFYFAVNLRILIQIIIHLFRLFYADQITNSASSVFWFSGTFSIFLFFLYFSPEFQWVWMILTIFQSFFRPTLPLFSQYFSQNFLNGKIWIPNRIPNQIPS